MEISFGVQDTLLSGSMRHKVLQYHSPELDQLQNWLIYINFNL